MGGACIPGSCQLAEKRRKEEERQRQIAQADTERKQQERSNQEYYARQTALRNGIHRS